jgi:hypothetical protein
MTLTTLGGGVGEAPQAESANTADAMTAPTTISRPGKFLGFEINFTTDPLQMSTPWVVSLCRLGERADKFV